MRRVGIGVAALICGFGLGWAARTRVSRTDQPPRTRAETLGSVPTLRLFLLAGQSNMSGRAEVPRTWTAPPRTWVFGNDYRWRRAAEPIDSPAAQVDRVSLDPKVGYSPASPFCRELRAEGFEEPIGLVPCARGGSALSEWRRSLEDSTLYGSLLKRARAASTRGSLAGLLWYQGEEDAALTPSRPGLTLFHEGWGREFARLVADLRRDLGAPALPVVFASLASTRTPALHPFWRSVQEEQQQVRLPFSACVRMADLPLQDTVHLSTAGVEEAGKRFARAWLALRRRSARGLGANGGADRTARVRKER
jgi:hypothetical protein